MVRITSALAFLALGSSILANPIAASALIVRADIGDRASAVGDIADVIEKAVILVQNMIDEDLARRRVFTQKVASDVAKQFPGHNVVVCNVGYSLTGPGRQLVYSTSYRAKVGSKVTFDVIVFKNPKTFNRQGDGGFENWAFHVNGNCRVNRGIIHCP